MVSGSRPVVAGAGGPGGGGGVGSDTATATATAGHAGTAPPAVLPPGDAYAAVVDRLGPMSEAPMVSVVCMCMCVWRACVGARLVSFPFFAAPSRERGRMGKSGTPRRSPRPPLSLMNKPPSTSHPHTQVPPAPPLVLVISGPSGVGKDAALAALIAARPPGSLRTVVTATTRPRRPGEVDGVDYQFVSPATFRAWIEDGHSLLEHAVVYGEYKGIPRAGLDAALAAGSDVALRVDVQGAAALRALLPGAVRVFLVAESEAALVRRLTARKTEPVDALATRVGTARREVREAGEFDYSWV
jgi:guanylate kinase